MLQLGPGEQPPEENPMGQEAPGAVQESTDAFVDDPANDPSVLSFQNRIKKFQDAAAGGNMNQDTYDIRLKAELRKYMNQTPGLSRELQGVFQRYSNTDDYARVKAMEKQRAAAQKASSNKASTSLNSIEKYGTSNFGVAPGWTEDPSKIKYVQTMEGLLTESKRSELEINVLENHNKGAAAISTAATRVASAEVGSMVLGWTNPDQPFTLPIPDGKGGVMEIDPHSIDVRNLNPEQKNMLEDQLRTFQGKVKAPLQARVAAGALSEEGMGSSFNAMDTYFDTAYAMLSEEGRASRAADTGTQESLINTRKVNKFNEVERQRTIEGYKLADMRDELEGKQLEQDIAFLGTRYSKLFREQMLTLGGNQLLMEHPDALKLVTLQSLGLDTNNPGYEAMNRNLGKNYMNSPRSTFFTEDQWSTHLKHLGQYYDNLDLNVATTGHARATAEHLNGIVNDVVQIGTRMTLDESRSVMSVLAKDGVEGLVSKFPEAYETLGENLQKTLPNFGRTFVHKLENDLQSNKEFLRAGLFIDREEDGTFTVGSAGSSSALQKGKFQRKYIDTLNTYSKALQNVSGVDAVEAGRIILENVDTTRVTEMYRDHFENIIMRNIDAEALAGSPLGLTDPTAAGREEGEAKVEDMTRTMVNSLFGEGAYTASQEKWFSQNGYKFVKDNEVEGSIYGVYENSDGDRMVLRK